MRDRLSTWKRGTISRVERPRTTRRDDLITALLSTWLVVGLFIDGWAHNNLEALETFLTPWHAALYTGYAATATWMAWLVLRELRRGAKVPAAIPVGYGLGLVGAATFAAAGAVDFIWHSMLGVEVSIEALLSPPHLVLFTAGVLMATSPLRAAWSSSDPRRISWTRFMPPLLSITLTTAAVAFFFQYVSAFLSRFATAPDAASLARLPGGYVTPETSQIIGIVSVLVTNLILMAPVLLILRRWHPPFGSVTFLFTTVAAMMASQHQFEVGITILAAMAGGLAADVLIGRLRPLTSRPAADRLVAAIVPMVLWTTYFLLLDIQFGVTWVTELWGGTIVLASLSGLVLSLLMTPPVSGAEPGA
ncbi:MAG TPA: hypothetical protein VF180_13845 [Acidimicrobiia bacterium]